MMFHFNPMFPNINNDQKWEQIKLWRNKQLAQSDWTQLPDAPADKVAWAAYRQALRDLPAQGGDPEKAKFPTAP